MFDPRELFFLQSMKILFSLSESGAVVVRESVSVCVCVSVEGTIFANLE